MKRILFLSTFSFLGIMLSAQTTFSTFSQGGTLEATYYSSGELTERITYFENGAVKEIATFINLIPDGEWLTFNKGGQVIQRGNYINGKKTGEWVVNCEISNQVFRLLYVSDERIAATEFITSQ